MGNSDACTILKSKLENLPENVVVIGSHTQLDNRKEKVCLIVLLYISSVVIYSICWIFCVFTKCC